MKTIRLGLIDCGSMMEAHASNINKVEGIEITTVCDIIEDRAVKVAEALGNNPRITTDFYSMGDDIDAIPVALPHDLHYECGMFFARKKKHILMEKPLCNTARLGGGQFFSHGCTTSICCSAFSASPWRALTSAPAWAMIFRS